MWFFRRLILLFFFQGSLFSGGCGFSPLLTALPPSSTEEKGLLEAYEAPSPLQQVQIDRIPDRSGQQLRHLLQKRLTPQGVQHPVYRLVVVPQIERQQVGIGKDATTKRVRLVVTLSYGLSDLKTGRSLHQGKIKTYGSFGFVDGAYYSNTASQDAALLFALRSGADLIRLDLASFFRKNTTQPAEKI